jgi:hypothetical protein
MPKKLRSTKEVLDELKGYVKVAKTDTKATNHILIELLVAVLEVRDILNKSEDKITCNYNVKIP